MGNEHKNPMLAPDNLNSYWSADGLQRRDEQFALIRKIVDAMPKPDMIRHLYEVFTTRCQGPLFNVIHTPTFLAQAEDLYFCLSCSSDQERQAMILWDKISMDTLACHLLAVCVSLQFSSNSCSRCRCHSSFLRSPFIRPRQYMAGLLRIFLSRHWVSELQVQLPSYGGHLAYAAFKEGSHFSVGPLLLYKLPWCFSSMGKKSIRLWMQSWSPLSQEPRGWVSINWVTQVWRSQLPSEAQPVNIRPLYGLKLAFVSGKLQSCHNVSSWDLNSDWVKVGTGGEGLVARERTWLL